MLLSDVHLVEIVEPPAPGWWEYKAPEASQDASLVAFMEALEAQRPDAFARTELIFNGDTFDFDSVYSVPEGRKAPPEGLPSTVAGAVHKMRRLLDDHAHLVAGMARFLAHGNRVTFVMGNHDRELAFREVQALLRQRLAASAPPGSGRSVAAAVSFEPWFVHEPGLFYAEHGQQYDSTCSYRDVLDPLMPPTRTRARELELSFGSVMARKLLCRLGTFNPFNDESFLLSLSGYARHWARYYWPRRSIVRPYLAASLSGWRDTRRQRKRALSRVRDTEPFYDRYRQRPGISAGFVTLVRRLSSIPLSDRPRLLLHELWFDRWALLAAVLAVLVLGALNVRTWTQGLLLVMVLPVVFAVLRMTGRGSLALQERGRWGLVAEQIAEHLGTPVVAFGHSHRPERRPLAGGGRYYNLGSWAPILESDRETTLGRARRFLIVRARSPSGGRRGVYVSFQRWEAGKIAPY